MDCSQWLKVPAKDMSKDKPYHGIVYVVEHGDKIKIGQSRKFKKRLAALRKAENYGGAEIGTYRTTEACTNYKEIEKYLHTYFKDRRVGRTELFDMSLKEFLEKVPTIEMLDESIKLEELALKRTQIFKQLLFGDK